MMYPLVPDLADDDIPVAVTCRVLGDRELYLPQSWFVDDQRCAVAGVPDDIKCLTKPALATGMLTRTLDAGVPARWVVGDEVYGADPGLAPSANSAESGMCWPSAATAASPPQPDRSAPTN